jgi:hypothetical protein
MGVGFRLGKWHDYTTYQCEHCPFDTMKEPVILQHLKDVHGIGFTIEELAQRSGILLADARGREKQPTAPLPKQPEPKTEIEEVTLDLTEAQVNQLIKAGVIEVIDPPEGM